MTAWLRLALAASLALAPLGPARAAIDTPLEVGAPAPPVVEHTASGTFDSAASNRPYVIELFAVWCPHCQREVPVVNRLAQAEANRLDVIAVPASPVAFDHKTPLQPADVDAFVQRMSVAYPVGFDGTFAIAQAYGLAGGFPTFYFVDRSRHITAVESGEVPYEELAADAAAVLAR